MDRLQQIRKGTTRCVVLGATLFGLGLSLAFAHRAAAEIVLVTNFVDNSVSRIESKSQTVIGPAVAVGECDPRFALGPAGIAVHPDGSRAYVTNYCSNNVWVLDPSSGTIVGGPIPTEGAYGIAITPDGTRAYVTNANRGAVTVIDTSSNATVDSPISVGSGPNYIAITPDGRRAYVANKCDGTISVIDTLANAVVSTIPAGCGSCGTTDGPFAVAIAPDGRRAYVTNLCEAKVIVIDTETNAVSGIIDTGYVPSGVALSLDGTRLYVTNVCEEPGCGVVANKVSVIDSETLTDVAIIEVGRAPSSITLSTDGTRAYVANSGDDTVSVIDTAHNTNLGSPIRVGREPWAVAVSGPQRSVEGTDSSGCAINRPVNMDGRGLLWILAGVVGALESRRRIWRS